MKVLAGLGLSPRVRGNPLPPVAFVAADFARSIPACAGEPAPWEAPMETVSFGVYPRVCGGTYLDYYRKRYGSGLSPRVRGNQSTNDILWRAVRSIPACAGEPGRHHAICLEATVYPRVCGGTAARTVAGIAH